MDIIFSYGCLLFLVLIYLRSIKSSAMYGQDIAAPSPQFSQPYYPPFNPYPMPYPYVPPGILPMPQAYGQPLIPNMAQMMARIQQPNPVPYLNTPGPGANALAAALNLPTPPNQIDDTIAGQIGASVQLPNRLTPSSMANYNLLTAKIPKPMSPQIGSVGFDVHPSMNAGKTAPLPVLYQ